MDQNIKTKWLEALRSGKYKQGKEYLELTNDDGVVTNCCLGVLCRILDVPAKVEITATIFEGTHDSLGDGDTNLNCDGATYPPKDIIIKAEIPVAEIVQLAVLNDGGKSFNEIADYIEEKL